MPVTGSGDEYVADGSDDDLDGPRPSGRATRSQQARRATESAQNFEVTRTWDLLTEGADGTITGAIEGLLEAGKRKRCVFEEPCYNRINFLTISIQTPEGHNAAPTWHYPPLDSHS